MSDKSNNKSDVWMYFTRLEDLRARCNLCLQVCKHSGNTTNLKTHLKRHHFALFNTDAEGAKKMNEYLEPAGKRAKTVSK